MDMKNSLIIGLLLCSMGAYAQRNKPVEENLAAVRPHFPAPPDTARHYAGNPVKNVPVVKPVLTVDDKVDFVLDSIDRLNSLRKFLPGYTIQVYSGLSREEAGNARKRLSEELDMRADLQYVQPKFRLRVGYYFTSIDAQRDLVRLKRVFPNAILVPESIPIK
jgi:hypothetical protein